MAASMEGIFRENLQEKINLCKILVVGAGGIGCELIKNLVLSGFHNIELIDLDTIDVSNLNRQFLFRKQHVGKSKAEVAKQSALRFNPDANIVAYHDSIMSSDYSVEYFKKFDLVMNALDNRAARNHVNRMCLAADIPLIESGTAGYLGQVTVIKKNMTECYECQPKPAQKTYPGCTIRNTPSEPIHCIVWAKHLFNQLYGEHDPDQDVSPDTEDPEAAGDAGEMALQSAAAKDEVGGLKRTSTRTWAKESDPVKIFNKLFRDDIKYLLSMKNLWKKRRPPTPLDWNNLPKSGNEGEGNATGIKDQRVWSIAECGQVFDESCRELSAELNKQGDGGMLIWDKDDEVAMNFVTCASNVRAHIFGIPTKSKFDIKSMAGNIIPAIATTNAVIAGLIVMEGLKILSGHIDKCKTVYLNRQANPKKKLLVPCALDKPNPKCYVCSDKSEVTVRLNTTMISVHTLQEKILKGSLCMQQPDVEIDDGKGTILISSEPGETDENNHKLLSDFGIGHGSRLKVDDYLQVFELNINILHIEKFEDDKDKEFEVVGDVAELKAKVEAETAAAATAEAATANGNGTKAMPPPPPPEDDDDDLMIVESDEEIVVPSAGENRKRKVDDISPEEASTAKRKKLNSSPTIEEDDDVVVLE